MSIEEDLWRRGQVGDSGAFASIFDLHKDRVFRHAYALLHDRDDAEDAAAVTFLELWRRRQKVRVVNGTVLPWLLVTTTNISRNLIRSRSRYARLLRDLPRADPRPDTTDPVHRVHTDPQVAAALQRLPAKDAQLLVLIALEDLSVADAATVLRTTPGAARTRLHRIRSAMQRELGHSSLASYLTEEPA